MTKSQGFRRYESLKRLGDPATRDIDLGRVFVFPKVDGTNASIWMHEGQVCCGSRNRVLSTEEDNAGFCRWLNDETGGCITAFIADNPHLRIYGEWLVPHTIKGYREDAWRKLYVFDVYDSEADRYLGFTEYANILEPYRSRDGANFDVIQPLAIIQNPGADQLLTLVEQNTYLMADGAGLGEGVVLKNYEWHSTADGHSWAKIVRNSFREDNARGFGAAEFQGTRLVEQKIVDEYVTPHLVGKTRAKVVLDVANQSGKDTSSPNWQQEVEAEHRHRVLPQLLSRVFHDLVTEEIWGVVKKHKNPTVDFRKLSQLSNHQTKRFAGDLFA